MPPTALCFASCFLQGGFLEHLDNCRVSQSLQLRSWDTPKFSACKVSAALLVTLKYRSSDLDRFAPRAWLSTCTTSNESWIASSKCETGDDSARNLAHLALLVPLPAQVVLRNFLCALCCLSVVMRWRRPAAGDLNSTPPYRGPSISLPSKIIIFLHT